MKEVYDEYCIPVFGNPLSPMGKENHYSCDFLNVGAPLHAQIERV